MGVFGRFWMTGVIILFLLVIPRIHGWGKEGHYTICKIAENYLSEGALAAIKALLPDNAEGDLAAVCSWPDEVKHKAHYRWSSPLHYVDTPDFRCNYKYCSMCWQARMFDSRLYSYTWRPLSKCSQKLGS